MEEEKLSKPCHPFFATVRKSGEMLEITIPKKTVDFEGWCEGDEILVSAQKVLKKEE